MTQTIDPQLEGDVDPDDLSSNPSTARPFAEIAEARRLPSRCPGRRHGRRGGVPDHQRRRCTAGAGRTGERLRRQRATAARVPADRAQLGGRGRGAPRVHRATVHPVGDSAARLLPGVPAGHPERGRPDRQHRCPAGRADRHAPRRHDVLPARARRQGQQARAARPQPRVHRRVLPAQGHLHGGLPGHDPRRRAEVAERPRDLGGRDRTGPLGHLEAAALAPEPAHHGLHADGVLGPGGRPPAAAHRGRPVRSPAPRHAQQLRQRRDPVGHLPDLRGELQPLLPRAGRREPHRGEHCAAGPLRRRSGRLPLGRVRRAVRRHHDRTRTSRTASAGSSRSTRSTRARRR